MKNVLHETIVREFKEKVRFNSELILRTEAWQSQVQADNGICLESAIALDNIQPGLLNKLPRASFTVVPGRTNYEIALESSDNIIIRAAKAIIQAFKDFIERIFGWFKERFGSKKRVNPDVITEVITKESVAGVFEFFDKYPEVIETFISGKNVNEPLLAGLKGGKLLESYFHLKAMDTLMPATTKNIQAIVNDGFGIAKTSDIKNLIFSYNSFSGAITNFIAKDCTVVKLLTTEPDTVANDLNAVRNGHVKLKIRADGSSELLVVALLKIIQVDGKAALTVRNDVQNVFKDFKKFEAFYDQKTSMEITKISFDEVRDAADNLTKRLGSAPTCGWVTAKIQTCVSELFAMADLIKCISDDCDKYAKAVIQSQIDERREVLVLVEALKKSPRAEPGDLKGLEKSINNINSDLKNLEDALAGK